MASPTQMTPRQKMINLMYIVFLAMLAMNVSSDVLDGFKQVEDSLSQSTQGVQLRNEHLYQDFESLYAANPVKSGVAYRHALVLRQQTDSIYTLLQHLKREIVLEADGADGQVNQIKRRDDLEATNLIMLSPIHRGGERIRSAFAAFQAHVAPLVTSSEQKILVQYLQLQSPTPLQSWESSVFEQVPVSAAVTLLTKLQHDICHAEGVVLQSLMETVDKGDLRVNQLQAFLVPVSRQVIQGMPYEAQVVLGALDTTSLPHIMIDGKALDPKEKGWYRVNTTRQGVHEVKGYLEVQRASGTKEQLPFSSTYMVQEPMATVSNTMMNVLYAGIDNPLSISVPGVSNSSLSVTMTHGMLKRTAQGWIAKPEQVGQDVTLRVQVQLGDRTTTVAQSIFKVRPLPMPRAFLTLSHGGHYKGATPLAKQELLGLTQLQAAIDDGLLEVGFRVLSFETVFFDSMGNAIPEVSAGDRFSPRQRQAFKRLTRGKRFYISRIKAVGPDGVERLLSPMEVLIN